MATRRRIAALVAVIGIVVVAGRLESVWPREVEVAFEVAPTVEEIDADYVQSGDAIASVRFARSKAGVAEFRHVLRLRPGAYDVRITVYERGGGAAEVVRPLTVPTAGLTRFDLRRGLSAAP